MSETLFIDSLKESDFLYNPAGGPLHAHSATLLETSAGGLLAAWYAYPEKENLEACIVIASRTADEREWNPSRTAAASAAHSLGNPVLFETPDGIIHLLHVALKGTWWNSAAIQEVVSENGGRTWSKPISLGLRQGLMIRHGPVQLSDGSLLLPAYDEGGNRTVLLRAEAPYRHWDEAHCFAQPGLIQPQIVTGMQGKLDIYFRPTDAPCRMWRSSSKDQGASWSPPEITGLVNPLSGIAAVMADETLGLIHNPIENQRTPLAISLSRNHGRAWVRSYPLDVARFEVSYPAFITGRDGMIRGVYTFNRRMIKYIAFSAGLLGHAAH